MTRGTKWMAAFAAASLLQAGAELAAHPEDEDPSAHVFSVNKSGEVKIGEDVAVGTIRVKKGRYRFEHRVEADTHTIVLTGLGKDAERTYEIPMRFFPSPTMAKRSALIAKETNDHSLEVTVVEVAGEAGDHLAERASMTTGATQ